MYVEEKTKAHNEIFNHPQKFCRLYIDSSKSKITDFATGSENFITGHPDAPINYLKRRKELLKEFYSNTDIIKKLSTRSSIKANQFNLCTAKVLDLTEYDKNECEIGVVYFSEIVFDPSKRIALVFVDHHVKKDYYGRNAVFKLRLNNDNYWEIEDFMLVSTS